MYKKQELKTEKIEYQNNYSEPDNILFAGLTADEIFEMEASFLDW